MAAGADRLDVADHLMLGAERGDEQAVAWLRDAARDASAQAPLVTVELIRRAEALLPSGHWGLFDALGMMQQLGAIPAPASA